MDFSHIHGRYSEEENLPWDFKTVINKYLKNNMKLLTMERWWRVFAFIKSSKT